MEDCIFCKIVRGEIPSEKVYEDEDFLAFKDINPAANVHVLIIPKKHCVSILDADSETMAKLPQVVAAVADEMGIKEKGFRLITNSGKESGQEVFHLHFHLLGGQQMRGLIG